MIENERLILQPKSSCQTMKAKMKESLFITYDTCLININSHPIIAIIVISFSFLNLFAFVLDEKSNIYQSENEAGYIKMLPRFFSISYYLKTNVYSIQGTVITFCIIELFELGLFAYLLSICSRQREDLRINVASKIFYIISLCLFWIFYMPLIDINIEVIWNYNLYGITYLILAIISILFGIFICLLHSYFGHSSYHSFSRGDGFARVDCNFELLYLISRTIIIILYCITIQLKLSQWIIIGTNAFFALVYINFNRNKFLFYQELVSITFMFHLLLYAWTVIVAINASLSFYKEPFWLFGLGIFFLIPASYGIINHTMISLIKNAQLPSFLNTPYFADRFLKELCHILYDDKPNDVVLVSGISDSLEKECQYDNTILKTQDLFYIPNKKEFMNKEDFARKAKHYDLCFILSLFQFYLKNIKHPCILVSYLNFQYEEIGNVIELLFQLFNFKLERITLQQEFSIHRIKQIALDKSESVYSFDLGEIEKKEFKMAIVISYYSLVTLLKKKMIESANAAYSFWNTFVYNSENSNIYESGIQLFEGNWLLESLFNQIRSIYSRDDYLNMKFAEYIRMVKGDEKLANKYQGTFEHFEHFDELREMEKVNTLKEFFFSSDTVIFIVNITKERNTIERLTESLYQVFGYSAHQMLGKDLENFMPPFFKERHQSFISFHFLTGIKRIISKETLVYGFNSKHYVFPIQIMILMLPSINNKLMYMGITQKISVDYGMFLVYPNGKIDSLSEKLAKILDLTHEDIIENDIYIYHIIMSMLIVNKNGKDKVIDLKKFSMTAVDMTKMKYCIDSNVILNYRRALKQYESNHRNILQRDSTSVSLKETVQMYFNSPEANNWPFLETEVIEEVYQKGINKEDNTLFIVRVFIEDNDQTSSGYDYDNSQNEELISLNNNFDQNKDSSFNQNNSDEFINDNNQDDKLLNEIVIKNLNNEDESKNLIRDILREEQNKKPAEEVRKFKRYDGLSSIGSSMSSSLYSSYSNFRKKLSEHLNLTTKCTFTQMIGLCLLLLLITASILIFFFEFESLKELKEVYTTLSTQFTRYDDMNCVEKLFNDDIARKIGFKNSRDAFSYELMADCIDQVLITQNYLNKITSNSILNQIKLEQLTLNYSAIGFETGDFRPSKKTIPTLQFYMQLLDYIQKLNLTKGYCDKNNDFQYVKKNMNDLVYVIFNNITIINNETFTTFLKANNNLNNLYLALRLSVIFLSFIIILPILIIKKNDQLQILDNFFQIRNEDAEMQRDNCKLFLESTSNFRLDDSKDGNKEEKEEKTKEEEKIQKEEDERKQAMNENFGFSNKKDNDKKKQNKKGKSHFSSQVYVVTVTLVILCIIIVISIVPLVNYQLQREIYLKSKMFFDHKLSVDNYAFQMEKVIIVTQNILIKRLLNESITSGEMTLYNITYFRLFSTEKLFSDFTSSAYSLSLYDELYTLLQKDMCVIFDQYNYTIRNCIDVQNANAQKGIKPIFSQVTSILTDISQAIIGRPSLEYAYSETMYNSINFQYLLTIIDQFIIQGFNVVLDILIQSYNEEIKYQTINIILLFSIFIIVLIINQLVIWNTISKKIHSMETDTYKLFAILPLGFITEYPCLLEFLNKITKEDN